MRLNCYEAFALKYITFYTHTNTHTHIYMTSKVENINF